MAKYKITHKGSGKKEAQASEILGSFIGETGSVSEKKHSNAYVGESEKVKRAEKFIGNKMDAIYGRNRSSSTEDGADDEAEELLRHAFDDEVSVDGKLSKKALKKAKKQGIAPAENTVETSSEDAPAPKINSEMPTTAEDSLPFEKTAVAPDAAAALAGIIPDDGEALPQKPVAFDFDDPNLEDYDDEVFESGASAANEIDAKPSVGEVYESSDSSDVHAPESLGNTSTLTRIFSEKFVAHENIPETEKQPDIEDDKGYVVEKKKKKVLTDIDEYTSFDQNDEISESFRDKSAKLLLSTIVMVIVTLALFYLESYSFLNLPRFAIFEPGRYGIVLLLIDLQLVFISALLILDDLLDGIKSLFTGRANKNSAVFLSLLAAAVQVIAHLVFNPSSESITLYSTVAAFFALMTSFSSFLDVKRNYLTFRIISSKQKDKLVASELGADCEEAASFGESLDADSRIYTISKARFIDGFFARLSENPQSNNIFKISVPLIAVVSIAFGILIYTSKDSILDAICAFSLMMLVTTPVCSVFISTLPFFRGSKKAAGNESAIIGEASIEDYSQAAVVSFNDTEVFPPKGVKVTSVRTYGENRIDRTILYAAKIFETVGGPLSIVFKNSISGILPQMNEEVKIIENGNGGICATIDGKEIYVGSKEYMLSYEFGFIKDDIDASFESNVGRIMYMAIGDEIAAKFYVRYSMSRSFTKLMANLMKSGICPSIKTRDPNIDQTLVATLMGMEECPVGIVKLHDSDNAAPASERSSSGIVSGTSISSMLKTFVLCDRIRSHIGTGSLIKFISLILGVFIMAFLYFIGRLDSVTMPYVLAYQALWLIPVVIPSYFD